MIGNDRGNGGRDWTGAVGEVVSFNSKLSDLEREKVESYLAHKWGLSESLSNSHSGKQSATIQSPKEIDSYSVDLSSLVSGNTYYYRVKASNSQGTDWADQTASFKSESSLSLSSGDLVFNTSGPTPSWYASDGAGGNGELQTLSWTDASSNTIQYKVAKFSFTNVNIGDGVNVILAGDNPIHIDASGDITISTPLSADGVSGDNILLTSYTQGTLGGGEGGSSWVGAEYTDMKAKHGKGPSHFVGTSPYNSGGSRYESGDISTSGLVSGRGAGGGSYGGAGARKEPNGGIGDWADHAISGQTYGTINIDALLAGSGGGAGRIANGGSGAGAIKITAGGTLTVDANISATGGRAGNYGDHSDFGPGYRLWFDASDESSIVQDSSGKVSAWIAQDRIEWGSTQTKINLYQSTASAMPTYGTRKQNGLNVVDFDGGDRMTTTSSVPDPQSHHFIAMVAEVDAIDNANDSLFMFDSSSNDFQFDAFASNGFRARFYNTGLGTDKTWSSSNLTGPKLYTFLFSGQHGSGLSLRINGVDSGSTAITNQTWDSQCKFGLMRNRADSNFVDGWVGEFIISMHYPWGDILQKTERSLMAKMGIGKFSQ